MIYDLKKESVVNSFKSGKSLVLDLAFHDNETELLAVGVKY